MNLPHAIKHLYYEQVWAVVQQIPHGKVATYGQITTLLTPPQGISADDYKVFASRWVGLAMAACPEHVPWQRVVNSQGKISPRSEAGKQKRLLEGEGVLFSMDKLDLNEYQWRGPGQSDIPPQGRLF